jgi:amino acid transporter
LNLCLGLPAKNLPHFMKIIILLILNLGLAALFIILLRRRDLLSYNHQGRWWLTWLAIGVITLMDEFTSIFYVPAEAYRFIGLSAIVFIAVTSLLIRIFSTRLTEIAEILEYHGLIGGGVYSFSYLVLGPLVSFVAVASIMVDYILTACISAVSAVANSTSFISLSDPVKMVLALGIIWAVAGLNILGIRENARFTFMIFIGAAFIMLNLIVSGILALDHHSLGQIYQSAQVASNQLQTGSWIGDYTKFISHIAFCILAYSGVESVLQTAGLARNWQEIRRSYLFLGLTVGVMTPLVAALALSAPINFKAHEGDLITHYASMLNGVPFAIMVAGLASFTLSMAINTAFVASSELMERVAHRYGFLWLIATNRRQSLYRIHILNATFFSGIILLTAGSQSLLADMYDIRGGTFILWFILASSFLFLAYDKHYATMLWGGVTALMLVGGFILSSKRGPELKEIAQSDSEMLMILKLASSESPEVHLYFRRSEESEGRPRENAAYVTFYSPRAGIPQKTAANHFRFPLTKISLYSRIVSLLKIVEYELYDRRVVVHLGWPMSSWWDRMAIGVMVFNLMRLPRLFPGFEFEIRYHKRLN